MLFEVKWMDADLWSHKGFVNADNRYEAQDIAQRVLTEQCIITKVDYASDGEFNPDMVTLNEAL